MKNEKILVVTQYFYPENFRINDFCKGLTELGYEVEVLTGFPNYPNGKFFNNYPFPIGFKETWNSIKIHRALLFPRGKTKTSLILNYISFPIFGIIKKIQLGRNYDIILSMNYSPIFSCIPGLFFNKKNVMKYIWIQDLWPESLSATNTINNKKILQIINNLTKWIYRKNDMIFVQSKSFIKYIQNQGVNKNKIKYLPNHVEDLYLESSNENILLDKIKHPIILFAGNIGKAQNLDITLETNKLLKKKNIKVSWVFIGEGRYKNEFIKKIKDLNFNNYHFLGSYPPQDMPGIYKKADALFVSLKNEIIFNLTIPSKIQSYLATGKPIIASLSGEGAKIISESKSGFASKSGDHKELSNNIIKFLELSNDKKLELGQNGKKYFLKEFSRKIILNKFSKYVFHIE